MFASFIIAASAAGQSVTPTIAVPPAMPPIVTDRRRLASNYGLPDAAANVVIPVTVHITAGNRQLLSDTFRVSRTGGASYQQTRGEQPLGCSQGQRYGTQERNSLSLNLNLRDDGSGAPLVDVSVQWLRPSVPPVCAGQGSRQVQLTQTVALAAGQTLTLHGDAGLTVTLSR